MGVDRSNMNESIPVGDRLQSRESHESLATQVPHTLQLRQTSELHAFRETPQENASIERLNISQKKEECLALIEARSSIKQPTGGLERGGRHAVDEVDK